MIHLAHRFSVEYDWHTVGHVQIVRGAMVFPSALTAVPAVYRLWIETGPGNPEVYIGETGDVRRRSRQYRRGDGSQTTSLWVHEHLVGQLGRGAVVTLQLMTDARYSFDGSRWHDTDLGLKEHRLILENAALAEAFAEEVSDDGHPERAKVLNRFAASRDTG